MTDISEEQRDGLDRLLREFPPLSKKFKEVR